MNDISPIEIFIVILSVAIVGVLGYGDWEQSATERFCRAKGFPVAEWHWIGPAYCIKRVDQTDVVMSVDSVRKSR